MTLFMMGLILIILQMNVCAQTSAGLKKGLSPREKANEGIDVEEHVGALLPMGSKFRDEKGNWYPLSHFFNQDRPVILSLNYSDCPMMCNLQLTELVRTLKETGKIAGVDYDFVTISIDPNEHSVRARKSKEKFTSLHGGEEVKANWHFLTAKQIEIDQITETIGFKYKFDRATKEFWHPPVLTVCSSDGKVLRYVHGVSFETEVLAKVIEESAEGKTGQSIGEFIFSCLLFREFTGKNSEQILQVMRLGGIATMVVLAGLLIPFWLGKRTPVDDESAAEPSQDIETKIQK